MNWPLNIVTSSAVPEGTLMIIGQPSSVAMATGQTHLTADQIAAAYQGQVLIIGNIAIGDKNG